MANATTIISRLTTRLSNSIKDREKPDFFTRDIGGHWRTNQPYISGYFQVMFGLPEALFKEDSDIASKWLHSTCESFTPHSQTITKVDVPGQGQLGSSYPANVITTREFTVEFREYQNQPILNIIRKWASVFDPFTGVSPLVGNQFIPKNYKGWCAVLQTKPTRSDNSDLTLEDLEECYVYTGVFPTNIPVDTAANQTIGANDVITLSVTFSFDGAPLTSAEPKIAETVIKLFNGLRYMGIDDSTYERYRSQAESIAAWAKVPTFTPGSKGSV